MDLSFAIANRAQAEQLRDALVPFAKNAVVINEGSANEERGYISAEQCYHDEIPPRDCVELARWEVGRGRVL